MHCKVTEVFSNFPWGTCPRTPLVCTLADKHTFSGAWFVASLVIANKSKSKLIHDILIDDGVILNSIGINQWIANTVFI